LYATRQGDRDGRDLFTVQPDEELPDAGRRGQITRDEQMRADNRRDYRQRNTKAARKGKTTVEVRDSSETKESDRLRQGASDGSCGGCK